MNLFFGLENSVGYLTLGGNYSNLSKFLLSFGSYSGGDGRNTKFTKINSRVF